MTQPRLFPDAPATRCGYCARPLVAHPTIPGAFACPRCRPILDAMTAPAGLDEAQRWDRAVGEYRAFVRGAHRDRVER